MTCETLSLNLISSTIIFHHCDLANSWQKLGLFSNKILFCPFRKNMKPNLCNLSRAKLAVLSLCAKLTGNWLHKPTYASSYFGTTLCISIVWFHSIIHNLFIKLIKDLAMVTFKVCQWIRCKKNKKVDLLAIRPHSEENIANHYTALLSHSDVMS